MYHFVLFSLTPSKIGHHLCTFSNHNSYLISKNVRTPKAFASQLFSLERILYETWNWLLTFLTTFLASNAGTDTPGSNKGHSDISDIIERNLFIYLHFDFVQLLFFSKSIVLALSCKTRDSSRDGWIEKNIKRKWSSGLFWAGGAAEKKPPNCHKCDFLGWFFQIFVCNFFFNISINIFLRPH